MRVLHLVASSRGGGAAHVRDLALGLDRRRFAVQVAMPEDGGHVGRADFTAAGLPFHQIPIAAGFSLAALRQLRRLSAVVDILHLHGARAALFGRLAWWSSRLRPRLIYTIHGFAAPYYPRPRRAILLAIERALAPLTDTFIAVCQAEREAFLAARIAWPERVRVIQNGIRASEFQVDSAARLAGRRALGLSPQTVLITTICRLDKPRDLDTLLHAFYQVAGHHPQTHLLIVGDGPLRPQVEQQVQALSLAGRVAQTGWRQELPQIYAASDIYALTTWGWEGLPLTVLEAMAAGLPVVATRAGGIPEAVLDGETGLLTERADISGLARALQTLIENPVLSRAMGASGQARAGQQFTAERMVREVAAVYTRR
ncbi:MAG: glycosyltransferase family 4 protein [Chloroflexi bacterium]|nr:glycosyltransferase family 4 protein [Chloroflexota bacterium]MCI0574638.1 glycosyltransferase family 4 protein [Chloroflexota bacterium]MCI0649080.1 glycosyltransferase family 4 protein [Chloroflexota bacterium]MCI0730535.1 glycosyltransferase family 4 protein [Chloroflexota bacterium]